MVYRNQTNHFCSNKCCAKYNSIRYATTLLDERKSNYYNSPKLCKHCSNVIKYENRNTKQIYCSHSCAATHTQKNGGHRKWSEESKNRMSEWAKSYAYKSPKKRLYKQCDNCQKEFWSYINQKSKNCCSRKCKNEWIVKTGYLRDKGRGGYRPNSGTSKKGWYNGIFCGSSWELAWVIYHIDHSIPFTRNKEGFPYFFNGKSKKYYPDFILSDGTYIEIKNYKTDQVESKSLQFPKTKNLKILYGKDLTNIFLYVINTYGKDYVKLYQKT